MRCSSRCALFFAHFCKFVFVTQKSNNATFSGETGFYQARIIA
jgi:hypothetical protein